MDIIAVNWSHRAPRDGLNGVDTALRTTAALPLNASVTIMVHGYRFCPDHPTRSPHAHILSTHPRASCWKAISWPRHLHLDRRSDHLGIAFGWPALGRLRPAATRAFGAGAGLGHLLTLIGEARPDLYLNLFAHSLGARVALGAIAAAPAHGVHRAILLAGAAYRAEARAALTSAAGRHAQIINVRSSENRPFDLTFRAVVPAPHPLARPLSAGLPENAGWTDLSIETAPMRAALSRLGHRIPPPATRFCHWSGYLRPGLFPLYRRLLDPAEPGLVPILRYAIRDAAPRPGGARAALSPLRSGAHAPSDAQGNDTSAGLGACRAPHLVFAGKSAYRCT